jgi:hypothetical protein
MWLSEREREEREKKRGLVVKRDFILHFMYSYRHSDLPFSTPPSASGEHLNGECDRGNMGRVVGVGEIAAPESKRIYKAAEPRRERSGASLAH